MDLRTFIEPQQGASYEDQLAIAQLSEELGFEGFFRSDHYLAMDVEGRPGPTDSWVTLAAIARETSTIRLGTLMTSATFRHPGPLAISVAQVDQMSGGRVELGLGAGWFAAEHAAYAIPFPRTGERFDRFEEQLAIITGLWKTPDGKTFAFEGRHYAVTDSPGLPKPVQQPHPPIVIGGKGARRTPALAARYAAEFNVPFLDLASTETLFSGVRAACEEHDRSPHTMLFSNALTVCCGSTEDEVRRRADATGIPLDVVRQVGLAGSPQQVIDRIAAYAALGTTRIYMQVLDLHDLDHLRLLAAEVLPYV